MMAERLPETCRVVIPIKSEFNASVGFIHKESVTMHGHTIVKKMKTVFFFYKIMLRFLENTRRHVSEDSRRNYSSRYLDVMKM